MKDQKYWTTIIRPKRHLLDINFRDILHYKDLIYLMVRRDFVAQYKQTILGPLWYIIQPLLTTFMFIVIFGHIAKIPTNGMPHILFYLSGLIIWNYFRRSLIGISNTFIANVGLFGKVYFPRLIIPISIVISNIFQFLIQFFLLMLFWMYFRFKGVPLFLSWQMFLLPLFVIMAGLMGLGFGLFISAMTIKYRDLKYLLNFGMQLWMYATPIVYPTSEIPERWKFLIMLNPISPIVEIFRKTLLGLGHISIQWFLYSIFFLIFLIFTGIIIFNKVERNFMDTV